MKIAIGTDHGGIVLKQSVIDSLKELNYDYEDFGTYDNSSVDYPDYAVKVAEAVASGQCDKGVLLCGTGIGISIAANKVNGIRAAVITDEFCAGVCSGHNNANIICMGGRVISPEKAGKLVKIWLNTPFEGGRHLNRINKIKDIENKYSK
jgi:ribose 5-phosphate isomerase B